MATNDNDDDDSTPEKEVEHCGTRSVHQVVAALTRRAEKEGRIIHLDDVDAVKQSIIAMAEDDDNHDNRPLQQERQQVDPSLIGRRIYKHFDQGRFFGTIERVSFEATEEDGGEVYYRVIYDDGDAEDLSGDGLEPWILFYDKYRDKDPKLKKKTKPASTTAATTRNGVKKEPEATPRTQRAEAGAPTTPQRKRTQDTAALVTPSPPLAKKQQTPPSRYRATMCISDIDWVKDMAKWLEHHNEMSAGNGKSVIRQVNKLAKGLGIGYPRNWPNNVMFLSGQGVTLHYDFDQLMDQARRYEGKYGKDKGHGWLLRHPIKKLKLYQAHCNIRPTVEAVFE